MEIDMKVVLNGSVTLVLEDKRTRRGYQMLSCSGHTLNPAPNYVVFVEEPQVGACPWVTYVQLDESGQPKLEATNGTRMPLSKSRITHVEP
jgi:hypothetical protein